MRRGKPAFRPCRCVVWFASQPASRIANLLPCPLPVSTALERGVGGGAGTALRSSAVAAAGFGTPTGCRSGPQFGVRPKDLQHFCRAPSLFVPLWSTKATQWSPWSPSQTLCRSVRRTTTKVSNHNVCTIHVFHRNLFHLGGF